MTIPRRQFIRGAAAACLAPLVPFKRPFTRIPLLAKSRVIQTTRARLVDSNESVNRAFARNAVEDTIIALTNAGSARDAWMSLFPELQTQDVIGIKINLRNSRGLISHPEIVYPLTESLIENLDMNPNNIIIWDQLDDEIARNGFEINKGTKGIRCFGTMPRRMRGGESFSADEDIIGYDPDTSVDAGNGKTLQYSKIFSQMCTYLINLPVLKDHRIAGVTLAMKNHYGTIDRPSSCHDNNGDPYIANINNAPEIKEKTKLILADAVFGCFQGGPGSAPQFVNSQLLASFDPVAIDTVALDLIDAQRRDRNLAPAANIATFLQTSAALGLGTNDLELIERVEA